MLNFKLFEVTQNVLACIELVHIIRKGQLLMQGYNERSISDQLYVLA